MNKASNRREALKYIAATGMGALVSGEVRSQPAFVQVAGHPIEVRLTAVSPHTSRITIQPIENGHATPIPQDGALVREDWGPPQLKWRPIAGTRHVRCGELVLDVDADPFRIRVARKG